MGADALGIGLSALLTSQHGLATAGHNIANLNTDGFSRQRVHFETRQPQFAGFGYVGKGVNVESIRRISDQFLIDQLRMAKANGSQADTMADLVDQVDRLVGNGLITDGLQTYFDAVGDANDDPRLLATRQVLLESTRSTVSRFADQEEQLNGIARDTNARISGTVTEINSLTSALAAVNYDIALSKGGPSGPPNDLLDHRDQLLLDLAELVGVQTQKRDDGMLNVLIGNGQLVVAGNNSIALTTTSNALDASRKEVAVKVGATLVPITAAITGGELGALVEFRDATLDPALGAIGRLAVSFALDMNAQHHDGMDLNGALGRDLFNIPAPVVNASTANSGTISVAFDKNNIGDLTTSNYRLRHNGTNFTLTRLDNGTSQTLSGAGPFNVDGLTISVTSAAAANDDYLLQPTKFVPRGLALAITDPAALALASPIRTSSASANIGNATIARGEILNSANAALLTTARIVFDDPPTTYRINGVGTALTYTSGANIDLNGWRVQVAGTPGAGDVFTVASNAGGTGDNANGLLLSALAFVPIMSGGTATFQEAYGALIGDVGATAQQSHINSDALAILSDSALASRDAVSGVNLDEEAADILRFQQSYQAAAQVIKTADALFQSLIDAIGG